MKLANQLDSLDSLDEKYRPLYTEKEGKFHLDSDLVPEDTTALRNAKQREHDKAKELQEQLDKVATEREQWEITKAELEGDKEKAEKLKQDALDRQKEDYENKSKDTISNLENRIKALTIGKLQTEIASDVYKRPDVMNLAFIQDRIKLNDKDEAYIVDKNGASMKKEDFLNELREDESMATFLKGNDSQGGGGKANANNSEAGGGKGSDMDKKKAALRRKYKDLD